MGEAQAAKPITIASRPPQGRDARPSCLVGEQQWWWAARERTATHAVTGTSIGVTFAAPWLLPQLQGETGGCGPGGTHWAAAQRAKCGRISAAIRPYCSAISGAGHTALRLNSVMPSVT